MLFSFSGRISRAEFAGWSAFQTCLAAILLMAIEGIGNRQLVAVEQHVGITIEDFPRIAAVLIMGAAIVVLPQSALMIKRLRDIGLPPWPCLAMISIVDTLIAIVVPHTPDGYLDGPFAGFALNGCITVLVALVPGRTASDSQEDRSADWMQRAAAAEAKIVGERDRQKMLIDRFQEEDALRRNRRVAERLSSVAPPPATFGRRR